MKNQDTTSSVLEEFMEQKALLHQQLEDCENKARQIRIALGLDRSEPMTVAQVKPAVEAAAKKTGRRLVSGPKRFPADTAPSPSAGKGGTLAARIVEFLKTHPGSDSATICSFIGKDPKAVSPTLSNLVNKSKMLKKSGEPRHYKYSVR